MSLVLATGPTAEPVTLAEAKAHCRVDLSDDDTLIGSLITAARTHVENTTRRALVQQTWDLYLSCLNSVEIPLPPLQSVTHVKYYDSDNSQQTLSTDVYEVDTYSQPGGVALAYGETWPSTYKRLDAVNIRFVAGYQDSGASPVDLADNIPQPIKHAMLLLIGHWYENRESSIVGVSINTIPEAVDALLSPYIVHYV